MAIVAGSHSGIFKPGEEHRGYKHGAAVADLSRRPRLYGIWKGMKGRCSKNLRSGSMCYKGRGIVVCQEWLTDFTAFQAWAESNGYEPHLQIDRINTNGNYEPGNCRFVTCQINQNNKRSNVFVSAWGETKTLAQWQRDPRCPVSSETLSARLRKGIQPEVAIETPADAVKSRAAKAAAKPSPNGSKK